MLVTPLLGPGHLWVQGLSVRGQVETQSLPRHVLWVNAARASLGKGSRLHSLTSFTSTLPLVGSALEPVHASSEPKGKLQMCQLIVDLAIVKNSSDINL